MAARALNTELPGEPALRSKVAFAFSDKITEWIGRSSGRGRADVVHEKLVSMGYRGSERTTRRVVTALKATYEHDHHRRYKPCITEPGGWLQYDFRAGPVIDGVAVILFCAWLAWISGDHPARRPVPALGIAALDRTFPVLGGLAPTYVLTDNERTLTDRHIAGIAVLPARRRRLPLLRDHHCHLCARRSGVQGGRSPRSESPRPTWCPPTTTVRRVLQLR